MKKDSKILIKLLIQPLYSIIVIMIPTLIFIALLIYANIFWTQESLIWRIIGNVSFSLLALICLFLHIKTIEIAIISEAGIAIKNIFGKIAFIDWNNIIKVSNEKLITHDSRAVICFNWIVIKTDEEQIAKRGGVNKKNKGPWQIIASKKNIETIKKYATKYAKNSKIEI